MKGHDLREAHDAAQHLLGAHVREHLHSGSGFGFPQLLKLRGSTFALRLSTLDFHSGGQRS